VRVWLFIIFIFSSPGAFTCEKGVSAFGSFMQRVLRKNKEPVKPKPIADLSAEVQRARFSREDIIENVLLPKRKRGAKLESLAKDELGKDLKLTIRQKLALQRIKSPTTTTEVKRAKSWNSKPSYIEYVPASEVKLQVEALRKAGITDPDVQVLALKSGILGFPPRDGIIKNFGALFGSRAAHEREVVAQAMSASDLFATRFAGSVDEMVKTNSFRDGNLYQGNLDLWWKSNRIEGSASKSPIVKEYGEGAFREVWWPKRQIEATKSAASVRLTAMDDMRIAINSKRTKMPDGRTVVEEKSIEVIAKNRKTGDFEPFYYEKVDGNWVARETFRIGSKELPLKDACIKCHKGSNGKFIPLPKKPLVKDAKDLMDRGYSRTEAEEFFRAFGKLHN
tara:strand:+ start:42476 stop:43654 length:1179 start_codon:yes stop_codon:yes gene_type:complete